VGERRAAAVWDSFAAERERETGRRRTEREGMRGGSLINPRIRGHRFLFLVWTKIKLPLFRSSESFVAPCH